MFKSELICMDGLLSDVINIRIKLEEYFPSKSERKLYRKTLNKYNVVIRRAFIDKEKEKLYQGQKGRFKGFVFDNLWQVLYDNFANPIFDTYEICVFYEEELAAVSFFDIGNNSVASIIGLFDKKFEKDSLGKFTLIAELGFALENEIDFYYPGYILDNDHSFDYKLRSFGTQILNPKTNRWKKYKHIPREETLSHEIETQLFFLIEQLNDQKMNIKFYPHHSFGYLENSMSDKTFVKSPAFIMSTNDIDQEEFHVLEFDLTSKAFAILLVEINTHYQDIIESYNGQLPKYQENEFKKIIHIKNRVLDTNDAYQAISKYKSVFENEPDSL